jgi:hypothetical protein
MCDLFQAIKDIEERGRVHIFAMFEAFSHKRAQEIPDDATAFPWRNGSDIFL